MPFAFNKSQSGNVEVFEEGKRIATATPELATKQYGYQAPATATAPKREPLVLSSEGGLDIDTKNRNTIFNIQKGIEEAQKTASLAQQQRVADIKAGEPLAFQRGTAIPLTNISGSPVTAKMLDEINSLQAQGISDTDKLGALKQKETDALSALQQAQSAIDKGDPVGLNTFIKQYNEQKKQLEEGYADYLKDVGGLRAQRAKLAIPGQREIEVKRQLNELRSQAKQFALQTEKDKLSEFEGQTLDFARGRAGELDIKASFKRQEQALQESNLLAELGLEQELRGFELKATEQQLDDFASDFALRSKIEDKLSEMETDILDKAQALRKEDQKTLSDILDDLKGSAFEDLSPESQTQLNNLARSVGLPIDLVKEGLKATKAREVFEQGIKTTAKETAAFQAETARRREERLGKEEISLPKDTVASRLNSVGLDPAVITTGNKLTKGNADKIAAKGVPPLVVNLITQAILEGDNLEDIRQALTEGHGRDIGFGYLDKYMSTLQEKGTTGTKLDQLLKSL